MPSPITFVYPIFDSFSRTYPSRHKKGGDREKLDSGGNGGDKGGGNGGNGDARITNKQLSYIVNLGKGLKLNSKDLDQETVKGFGVRMACREAAFQNA